MEKKKTKFSIVYKLIGMSVLPVILLGIVLSIYSSSSLASGLKSEIHEGLKSSAIAIQGAYDAAGNGDFIQLESGNIIKGTFVVNGNYNLVDTLREESNIDAAFYYGDKPIVTSLVDESNQRMLNLSPDDTVIEEVLKNGNEYFSEDIKIGEDSYYGYYMPVKTTEGKVCGMIFTGKKSDSVDEILSERTIRMTSISIGVVVAAVVITIIVAASITKSIRYAIGSFGKVAEGNLVAQENKKYEKRSDEIGDMISGVEKLKGSLRGVIGKIKESSIALMKSAEDMEETAVRTNTNCGEVGTAIEEISEGVVTQAQDTETALRNVEQMGNMIEQIVDDVHAMSECANDMGKSGSEVSVIIGELEEYTKKTTDVVDVIAKQISTTNSSAQEIRKAVDMITSIADETNLLSLNASIEAARAGEQGRGFAVVASQIQKLAEQSSQSAKQIGEIINVLITDAENTVTTMDEVVKIVWNQKEKLAETGERFCDVDRGIQLSLDRIEGVRDKSVALDKARNEILQAVSALAEVSEGNAAAAEETAASTIELKERVDMMAQEAVSLKEIAEDLEKQIEIFQM